jgi:hypothetical protein
MILIVCNMRKLIWVDDMRRFQRIWPENSFTDCWTYTKEFEDILKRCDIAYHVEER